jgi:hypothetical protein
MSRAHHLQHASSKQQVGRNKGHNHVPIHNTPSEASPLSTTILPARLCCIELRRRGTSSTTLLLASQSDRKRRRHHGD